MVIGLIEDGVDAAEDVGEEVVDTVHDAGEDVYDTVTGGGGGGGGGGAVYQGPDPLNFGDLTGGGSDSGDSGGGAWYGGPDPVNLGGSGSGDSSSGSEGGAWYQGPDPLNLGGSGSGDGNSGGGIPGFDETADFIADAGNSLLGVNADNMGIFEENAAGSKALSLASMGLAGEGGLVTDVLTPGQGKPGEHPVENQQQQQAQQPQQPQQPSGGLGLSPVVLGVVALGGAALVMGVGS